MGITRVRPLLGGFNEWKRLGYPLEEAVGKIGFAFKGGVGSTVVG
jgi:3-mercaptopyruvate sulfurtransferase SseA